MKRIMFVLLAVITLAVSSCSKESTINRKLQGDWKAITMDGVAVSAGESYTVNFSKSDKDSGTGTTNYTGDLGSYTISFTYSLAEDKLTMTSTILGIVSTDIVTVNTYTKDKIQWTDSEGKVSVLEPK